MSRRRLSTLRCEAGAVAARGAVGALAALGVAIASCALPLPEKAEPPARFVIEAAVGPAAASPSTGEDTPRAAPGAGARGAADGPVLLIAPTVAGPAFDGARMLYVTRAYEVKSFAHSEWADAPARMLAPLIAQALEREGGFRTVQGPSGALATLRLDTELLALQQEFTQQPSRVRFALRAQLVDLASRRLVATYELEAVEDAPSDDPYGGVVAASRAVTRVLRDLAARAATTAADGDRAVSGDAPRSSGFR